MTTDRQYADTAWHVEGEGQDLSGLAWQERASRFRVRAQRIFEMEKARILHMPEGGAVTSVHKVCVLLLLSHLFTSGTDAMSVHKALVEHYTLEFDKGTTRRAACKYPQPPRR